MKRSMAMILTGTTILVMTVTATVTGCQSDTSKEKEETLYGEVSKIDGNEITIALVSAAVFLPNGIHRAERL